MAVNRSTPAGRSYSITELACTPTPDVYFLPSTINSPPETDPLTRGFPHPAVAFVHFSVVNEIVSFPLYKTGFIQFAWSQSVLSTPETARNSFLLPFNFIS